ncbi:site-specific DNA-methyltransferase [uncultured Bacteroides sp.]|uniref:site-specific DNA-methyltransferase n=1 Tax=uncultured Bacteroides sp. TaxID=162156 RepID=UPI002613E7C0|nr:site-specific DNA-methyltransferase [uncultured Bacteroides sp.]
MNKISKPTDAIKHLADKRVAIPTTELAGEEAAAIASDPKTAEYKTFRHEFTRGRDPELYWLGKYRNDDEETCDSDLRVDIRSLYVHEDIQPEQLIDRLYRIRSEGNSLFGNEVDNVIDDELQRVAEYYRHHSDWKNRLIQGDSLLVMNSLLNREGLAGKVQCIYIDPPYGIKYGSNWQMQLNNLNVKDNDESLSGEPEMIKAFRDTWELGIHSYLSYLRDRLVLARELLTQSGSVFVQISDDNVHLVRGIMDEIFGSENFISLIVFAKTASIKSNFLGTTHDFILWYAKDKMNAKYRQLYVPRTERTDGGTYNCIEFPDGSWRRLTKEELINGNIPTGKVFRAADISRQGASDKPTPFEFEGKMYKPSPGRHWAASYPVGMQRLVEANRIVALKSVLSYKLYSDDFSLQKIDHVWPDTIIGTFSEKHYVVQTATLPIQRCILMTTDPGDLVLDPTCGSGTTAFVAEQWGRRWITIDTSRIAINIAKRRLMMATYPFYTLADPEGKDVRLGFHYKTVPHITLKSLANDEEPEMEVLYDQPEVDKRKLRVSGPFTVETLQSFNVIPPEELDHRTDEAEENRLFQERVFSHLETSGIRNGDRSQKAVFHGMESVASPYLHARGYYTDSDGEERLAYFHIGPKFGTVSKQAVNESVKEMRKRLSEGASWLVLLGFSFEDNINDKDYNFGNFTVSKVRMHDDLMQDGLLKKDKGAGAFITIGEPDIAIVKDSDKSCHVEIRGLDIYDPIKDIVKPRSVEDIAYWEMDDNYDGTQFIVRSIHFCGGDKKEFDAWRKGLGALLNSSANTKRKAQNTLHIEFSDEIWETLYGFVSEPIKYKPGRLIAVRVISQFGEEASKILTIE